MSAEGYNKLMEFVYDLADEKKWHKIDGGISDKTNEIEIKSKILAMLKG